MPFPDVALSIDMNFETMEGMIGNRGTPAFHELSLVCSCLQVDPAEGAVGHADPTCPRCDGKGFVFRDPITVIGLVTNLTADRFWAQVGWVEPGDLVFSPSTHARRIGNFDRIVIAMPIPVDSQVIVRGVASSFSPRLDGLNINEDQLYWEAGRREAAWLEDENGVVYRPGDYYLKGRTVVWPVDGGPPVGTKYSIKYEAYPEFSAWTSPVDRWDRNRELGQKVLLRRATVDPKSKQLRPPWEEALTNNGHFGRDDVYNEYGEVIESTVGPRR